MKLQLCSFLYSPVTSSLLGPHILGTITHYLISFVKIAGWGETRRWQTELQLIADEVTPKSHVRDQDLSSERNEARNNLQKMSVLCTFEGPSEPRGPEVPPGLHHCLMYGLRQSTVKSPPINVT